jgi:hypothetical protein
MFRLCNYYKLGLLITAPSDFKVDITTLQHHNTMQYYMQFDIMIIYIVLMSEN